MDDMSLDYGTAMKTPWKTDIMQVSNNDFFELTELHEKLYNAAHTGTIMHTVETTGWNELDHSQKWIAAGYGSRPVMDG
jgi:hypothetical protein